MIDFLPAVHRCLFSSPRTARRCHSPFGVQFTAAYSPIHMRLQLAAVRLLYCSQIATARLNSTTRYSVGITSIPTRFPYTHVTSSMLLATSPRAVSSHFACTALARMPAITRAPPTRTLVNISADHTVPSLVLRTALPCTGLTLCVARNHTFVIIRVTRSHMHSRILCVLHTHSSIRAASRCTLIYRLTHRSRTLVVSHAALVPRASPLRRLLVPHYSSGEQLFLTLSAHLAHFKRGRSSSRS